jgi:acyl-CoA thioester hydrolase
MKETEFKAKLKLRIDWSEQDLFGHVNNVEFFKYIQSARVYFWELIDLDKMLRDEKTGPLLASAECQFRKPLYYPGHVTIKFRLDFIKNTSFGLVYQLVDDADVIVAEARDVMVLWDFNNNRKEEIPEKLRRAMAGFEEK